MDQLDEQKSIRLRQRLWGAALFIALLVIFLPLLLDGSGSESQYRRVERLREEPPRILDAEGVPEPRQLVPETPVSPEPVETEVNPEPPQTSVGMNAPAVEPSPAPVAKTAGNAKALSAWVVQAGSFEDKANALAVRDRLRRAGFPSFVTPSGTASPLYRVRVGPMINLQQAEHSRDKVMQLLQREAIVVSYP